VFYKIKNVRTLTAGRQGYPEIVFLDQYLSFIVLRSNNPYLSSDRENGLTFAEQNINGN